ncbi:hypothetical protein [Pollutibacter soli]|uniref:hypothetical protein n=1 Tax=Pollutibacter soli TaxID=3034157 RepID=UPI003013FE88
MIKLIYSLLALLVSSAMYLFSNSEVVKVCNNELSGIVKDTTIEKGRILVIESADHRIYYPKIDDSNVILIAGAKVKICYEPAKKISGTESLIHVISVTNVP